MGSSAQNSSGVHWCRRRVRFNEVPEKVPEVRGFAQSQVRFNRLPEKVPEWEALVQSRVRFNRVPEKVLVKVWEALVQSQVRFNRIPEKVLVKVWEALVQQGPEKVPEKVPEQGSEGGSGEGSGRLWCRARSGSTGEGSREGLGGFGAEPGQVQQGFARRFWRRVQEALVQSQVRFNGFRRRLQRRSWRRFWESWVQGQVRFNRFNRVSSAWLCSTHQKDL